MERYLKNFDRCLEREIPFCQAECPFGLDVFNFIEKMERGAFQAAFRVYRNAVGYPAIASALCPAPCKGVCPRKEAGGAVEMDLLEKAAIALAKDRSSTDYNLPAKKERIAIIGAGNAGMGALLRLATKRYQVELFEKTGRLGGNLWETMDPKIFAAEFDLQLCREEYRIHFNTEIKEPSGLEELAAEGFDAVYVATGAGGASFGLLESSGDDGSPFCGRVGKTGCFAGGALTGETPVWSLACGLAAGTVIDNFLKTGFLYYPSARRETRLRPEMISCGEPAPPRLTAPAEGQEEGYGGDGAREEAARCVRCRCRFCMDHCDLVQFSEKWPVRLRDEAVATTLEGTSELKGAPAKRLLFMSGQSGVCKAVCPEDIDLDGLFLEGRKKLHRQGKAPGVYHEFWLKEMDFSNGPRAALAAGPPEPAEKTGTLSGSAGALESSGMREDAPATEKPGKGGKTARKAFFPGCRIGASQPDLVEKAFRELLQKDPDTGILLMCCGVPAEWSGDVERHRRELVRVREAWESLGKPELIFACPTCQKTFREHLGEIPGRSLYELLAESQDTSGKNVPDRSGDPGSGEDAVRVFDPCATGDRPEMQAAVRRLARAAGLRPSDEGNPVPKCCGTGGNVAVANPEYAAFIAGRRAEESGLPYVTYCINCRDNLRDAGKEARHILSVRYGGGTAGNGREAGAGDAGPKPTVTRQRENQEALKKRLVRTFWPGREKEELMERRPVPPVELILSPEMEEKLNRLRILREEAEAVADFCIRTGRTVLDEETGTLTGYRELGYTTLWITFRPGPPTEDGRPSAELLNAYTHRMKIELEAVWNGKKREPEM